MTAVFWLLTIALASFLSFELGRRWTVGKIEAEVEEFQAAEAERNGVRLNRIVMRR